MNIVNLKVNHYTFFFPHKFRFFFLSPKISYPQQTPKICRGRPYLFCCSSKNYFLKSSFFFLVPFRYKQFYYKFPTFFTFAACDILTEKHGIWNQLVHGSNLVRKSRLSKIRLLKSLLNNVYEGYYYYYLRIFEKKLFLG